MARLGTMVVAPIDDSSAWPSGQRAMPREILLGDDGIRASEEKEYWEQKYRRLEV